MTKVMMACGHASNSYMTKEDGSRIPACVICGCLTVDESYAGIPEGRQAKCNECGKAVAFSRLDLPFFKACPDRPFDEYYCGCWGWD